MTFDPLLVVVGFVAMWLYLAQEQRHKRERQEWAAERTALLERFTGAQIRPEPARNIPLPPGSLGDYLKERERLRAVGIDEDLEGGDD